MEITSDAFPGERLMVCRNPLLAEDRTRKRQELLEATEALLEPIAAATRRDTHRVARDRPTVGLKDSDTAQSICSDGTVAIGHSSEGTATTRPVRGTQSSPTPSTAALRPCHRPDGPRKNRSPHNSRCSTTSLAAMR